MRQYNYMKLVEYLTESNKNEIPLTLKEISKICLLDSVTSDLKNPKNWYSSEPIMQEMANRNYVIKGNISKSIREEKLIFIKRDNK